MTDLLQHSVTRDDYADTPHSGGIVFLQSFGSYGADMWRLPPEPPGYWSPQRDAVLRSAIFAEDMWAAGVYKTITKNIGLDWLIADSADSARRIKQAQELFINADAGHGWVHFGFRHLGDYIGTDKGAFVEIERASDNKGARVLGLHHLDGSRCMPTGNLEIPVLYTDLHDREHELKWYQVLHFTDMPLGSASYHGIGFCATSRAYKTIYGLAGLERYKTEKITGDRANGIDIIRGISAAQLQDAITAHRLDAERRGAVAYRGKILIPQMSNQEINVASIDLAGMPDGFNAEEERKNAYLKYANALGVAVQDIQPLSGQGLGTGQQSIILDEAAQGQGLAVWRKQWMHLINERVLSAATTFTFNANDSRDQKAKAEVQQLRATTRDSMIQNGTITAVEARNMAADADDIPKDFLAEDETPGGMLSDTQKPMIEDSPPPAPLIAVKAAGSSLDRLIARLSGAIDSLTSELESGGLSVDDWEAQMTTAIQQAYPAAYKTGSGSALDDAAKTALATQVKAQLSYLGRFALEIQAADDWQAGWNSRAQMYAEGIKVPYWQGKTKMLPLPAMPGEGSQCLTRCKCSWDVQQLDGDGNWDAYWRLGGSEHTCQTCVERAAQWGPLQIREGVLL